jgi:capsular exopolysaccharide synthesis family protein
MNMKSLEITKFDPLDYACNEALNTLCSNITFLGNQVKKIMITSCSASEGKSFLTMNMMRSYAMLGKSVVFVSGDLRRSAVGEKYGIRFFVNSNQGITHYLAGLCEMDDIIYKTNIDGAYMIPVGRDVSNSLALLSTPRLNALLNYLESTFDIVLVDAPPVGVLIDAAEISKSCDGSLLVVSYNEVRRRDLIEAKRQLELAGSKVLGVVLNKVSFKSLINKKYYNKSYYTHYYNYDQNRPMEKAKGRKSTRKR